MSNGAKYSKKESNLVKKLGIVQHGWVDKVKSRQSDALPYGFNKLQSFKSFSFLAKKTKNNLRFFFFRVKRKDFYFLRWLKIYCEAKRKIALVRVVPLSRTAIVKKMASDSRDRTFQTKRRLRRVKWFVGDVDTAQKTGLQLGLGQVGYIPTMMN